MLNSGAGTVSVLHTDLYQINMMKVYFEDGLADRESVFDLYFRKLPFDNGYAVFAGLERMLDYIKGLRFTEDQLDYLREIQGYDETFLDYLRNLVFTGTISSVREGEVVFANEAVVRVCAPLGQAQLIETALLNFVNYQTLIATKASRIRQIAPDSRLLEFGTRRAQEVDASQWGARASVIGGFDGTSNVEAGKKFGIPVSGTHAHAMVQTYGDDYTAFTKYASSHYNCTFLVDTFDTLKSGVPNAIRVAKEFGDKINFVGIRLDSGDMAYLSKEARKMLDAAGFENARIVASNDLDEYTITELQQQGARIDDYGVGTKLITAYDQPALGAVYKLVALKDEKGVWQEDRVKISGNPEKVTTPGLKDVYRVVNKDTGKAAGDYITMAYEDVSKVTELELFDPVYTYVTKKIKNVELVPMLVDVIVDGEVVYESPALDEMRAYHKESLDMFWDEYKRKLNPEIYPVTLSKACYENKMNVIRTVLDRIEK